jgi:bifunctional non-homologous end joining protein LigD
MTTVRMGRYSIELSNEEKIFFPGDGLTKGDVIAYYRHVADTMLPQLRGRPLVMERFPDGIEQAGFFHKDAPEHFPDWIDRFSVKKEGGGTVDHVVCDKAAGLVYVANQGCVTLHLWLSRVDRINNPDQMIVDLDPPKDRFALARDTAKQLGELLEELKLAPYIKTTGGKGLHVVVPLDRGADFDEVRKFARDAAKLLAERDPGNITTEARKEKRRGRLFLDVGRNAYGQHAVAPYSLRPRSGAPIATPLNWDELDGRLRPSSFTIKTVLDRVSDGVDPWAGMTRRSRSLSEPRRRLDRMRSEEG